MFTELPTLKEIHIDFQPWEYLKLSGKLFLKGEEIALLPEKERYTGGGRFVFYTEALRGGFYANDPLPITADMAEITIELLEQAKGIAKDIIFVSTTGEELRLPFPGFSSTETRSIVLYKPKPSPLPWVIGGIAGLIILGMAIKGRRK